MRVLVVKSAFKDYQKGDVISDPDAIEAVLKSSQGIHVVVSEHAQAVAPQEPAQAKAEAESEKSEAESHAA